MIIPGQFFWIKCSLMFSLPEMTRGHVAASSARSFLLDPIKRPSIRYRARERRQEVSSSHPDENPSLQNCRNHGSPWEIFVFPAPKLRKVVDQLQYGYNATWSFEMIERIQLLSRSPQLYRTWWYECKWQLLVCSWNAHTEMAWHVDEDYICRYIKRLKFQSIIQLCSLHGWRSAVNTTRANWTRHCRTWVLIRGRRRHGPRIMATERRDECRVWKFQSNDKMVTKDNGIECWTLSNWYL